MSNFLGAIVTVEKYLSQSDFTISIKHNGESQADFVFKKERKYIIPAFQREIRWSEENINMLLSDLSSGPQFLGNIILSKGDNNNYEIIDGQQRTTILTMIIECVNKTYQGEIECFDMCQITNNSFTGLGRILESGFEENDENLELLKTDDYQQFSRIKQLWDELNFSEVIRKRKNAKSLIENIKNSELNLIYCQSPNEAQSIRYFLDVNLKGVQLDKEDIFKSYLFSENSEERVKELWKQNKQSNIKLNLLKLGKSDKRYPLMKVYEHFFYCDLYLPKENKQDFSDVKFNEDFCLIENAVLDGTAYYKGTHVIEAICNKKYMVYVLESISRAQTIIIDIISTEGPSDSFKDLFCLNSGKIDSTEVVIIHSILQKTLLDKEVIPKVLALKYILSLFDGKKHNKAEYKSIYSLFVACVFFTVFANKKESDTFYSFVKSNEWISNISNWISGYTKSHDLTRGKLLAAYNYSSPENEDMTNEIRCKSLASIFNYYSIDDKSGKKSVTVSNIEKLRQYYCDTNEFSLEHLIIAKSGKLNIKTTKFNFVYEYSPQIKKYRNSLFNYIFIPREVNNELDNQLLFVKLAVLKEKKRIRCEYSNNYLKKLQDSGMFNEYPTIEEIDRYETEQEVKDYLDKYFKEAFPNEFLEFSRVLAKGFNI